MIGNPFPLKQNAAKSFQGSIVLGKGFVLTHQEAQLLIDRNPRNKDVIFPYLNGDDLNNDPDQKASRWVINFFDWSEKRARTYPDCFEIIERLVKPERLKQKDKGGQEKWWQFLRPRNELYETISKLDQVMAVNRHSKYWLISLIKNDCVYSEATVIMALNSYRDYAVLSSSIHEAWAWKNSSTMKGDTLRYSASNAFETFPFPSKGSQKLETLGVTLATTRKRLMGSLGLGLTDLQNLFHKLQLKDESCQNTAELRKLHHDIDYAVLDAYGWDDIKLDHNFYEVDYLPEKDRMRLTIHPNARKEILRRLFHLNKEIYVHQPTEPSNRKTKISQDFGLFSS